MGMVVLQSPIYPMDKKPNPVTFGERAELSIKLIVSEIKVSKLLCGMAHTGVDTSPFQPPLQEVIFRLACIRIEDENKLDKLKDWYYRKIEQSFVHELTDEIKLYSVAENILLGLIYWKAPETLFGTDL